MPDMLLSEFVDFLKKWIEDPRLADYEAGSPIENLGARNMIRTAEAVHDYASTILHMGDDDIYIAERAERESKSKNSS